MCSSSTIYMETRLEIALGDKVIKLFFSLPKNAEDSRDKEPLNASTTHYLSTNIHSVNQIYYGTNLGDYTKDSSNTFYIFYKNHIYIAHLNFFLMETLL